MGGWDSSGADVGWVRRVWEKMGERMGGWDSSGADVGWVGTVWEMMGG